MKLVFLLSCFPFISLKNRELTLDRLYTSSPQFAEDLRTLKLKILDHLYLYRQPESSSFIINILLLSSFFKFPFPSQQVVPYSKYLEFPEHFGITERDKIHNEAYCPSTEFTTSFDEFYPKLHIQAEKLEVSDLKSMIKDLKLDVRAIVRTEILSDIGVDGRDITWNYYVPFKYLIFEPIEKLLVNYYPTFEYKETHGIELFPTVRPPTFIFTANNHIVPVIVRYTGLHKNFNKAKKHEDAFSVSEDVRRLVNELLYSMIYSRSLMGFALDVDSVLVIRILSSKVVDTVVNPNDGTISKELDFEIFLLDHSLHYPMVGLILSSFLDNYFKTAAPNSVEITRQIRRNLKTESEELEASRQSKIEFVKRQYLQRFDDYDTAIGGGYINIEFPGLFIEEECYDKVWALRLIKTFTSSEFQIMERSYLSNREDIVHEFKGKLDGRSGTLFVYKISYTNGENEDFYKLVSISLNRFLGHMVECISKFGKYKTDAYNTLNLDTVNDNFQCAYYEREDISGFSLLLFDDAQELDEADKVEEYEGDPPVLYDFYGNRIKNEKKTSKAQVKVL